jgi:hypothetical protein
MKLSAKNSGVGVSAATNGIGGKNSCREMRISCSARSWGMSRSLLK